MRTGKLTFEEIEAAERASDNRHRSREQGFEKMHERDKAVQLMSNGALMLWHVPKELNKQEFSMENEDGSISRVVVYPPEIPEDSFGLDLKCKHCNRKQRYLFKLDEFRKWLRWA